MNILLLIFVYYFLITSLIRGIASLKTITIVENEKYFEIPFKSEYFSSVSTNIKVNKISDTDNLEITVNNPWVPVPLNEKKDTIYPFPIMQNENNKIKFSDFTDPKNRYNYNLRSVKNGLYLETFEIDAYEGR